MPFDPVVFVRGDTQKLVRFFDEPNGPPPWKVNMTRIAGKPVNKSRWTFAPDVGPDGAGPGGEPRVRQDQATCLSRSA